jgi:hypothetical protein
LQRADRPLHRLGELRGRRACEVAAPRTESGRRDSACKHPLIRRPALDVVRWIGRGPILGQRQQPSARLGPARAQLGEADEALRWLHTAAATGFACLPWFERDPLLDPLRRHPRFAELLEHVRAQREVSLSQVAMPFSESSNRPTDRSSASLREP